MPVDPRLPVLIGAGQVTHRAQSLDDGLEPAALMAEAVERAADDAGLREVPAADSVRVVSLLSWRYRDPAHFVAERLRLAPHETVLTTPGGQSPQTLVNQTAAEIQAGELDLAILTGGEAWRTRTRARKADAFLPWPKQPDGVGPSRVIGTDLTMSSEVELARGLAMPVQLYPMFETVLRAAAGEGIEEHQVGVSKLWARFSAVAAGNPYVWIQDAKSAEEIRTPSAENRMVGLPYPKYMNSNNDVDQAAALLICSVERAQSLGVSRDRWVFIHGGAECHEHPFVSNRWSYAHTPAIRAGGRAVLELAGVGIDDIELIDLYSCFPSAVQLGAAALGLSLASQLTRTGGLSFAGGPWNNYVMHAVATMVRELRERPGVLGLVWANGGFVTKHAFGVYSTEPPRAGFRTANPQDEVDTGPARALATAEEAAGEVSVEAYTVMHSRAGEPEAGYAACLLADGRRAWGTAIDPDTVRALCDGEWVERRVTLDDRGTLRL